MLKTTKATSKKTVETKETSGGAKRERLKGAQALHKKVQSEEVKSGSKTDVSVESYLSAGVHIGTKVKTKDMQKFIYKTNPVGLHVIDVQSIGERLQKVGKFLSKYNPDEILVISRRENGWAPVKAFAKVTGAKYFTGRYPAGVLTNPNLKIFIEPKVVLITDPWTDKNAVHDSSLVGITIIALCDTNNLTQNVDLAIPCNNKGAKSLALVYWLLASYYLKERGELKDKELDKTAFFESVS